MDLVTFKHDKVNDWLIDANGTCIYSAFSTMKFVPFDSENGRIEKEKLSIRDLADLKEKGFTSAEIIDMHNSGVI